jgi:hypothetical protein
MKNVNIIIAAVLLFAALSGIGSAVPRAPQDMGLLDTNYTLVPAAECKECHTAANDEHHAMVFMSTTTLKCLDCHPSNNTGQPIYETDCKTCHKASYGWNASQTQNISVWDQNTTLVNLSRIRGRGTSFSNNGLPHHNTTKNATWNSQKIAYWAADRKCDLCHGTGIVARYDDGHYVPTYNFSMISPLATFKINATVGGGVEWGGCFACHDDDLTASPELLNPDETHHGARMYQGYQCNDCHVSKGFRAEPVPDRNPGPNANYMKVWLNVAYPTYTSMFNWDTSTSKFEFRNSTMIQNGDTLNGTACEKCHSVQTLHNIEVDAGINIPGQVPGKGHIGNASDCNGCHSAAVIASDNPYPGEKSVGLNGVNPGRITAGVATDVTLTGDNFVEAPYQTVVLVDGNAVSQKSITDAQIVVTIPASLAKGGHSIVVKKGKVTSGLRMLSVSPVSTITSAKLRSGVLTITGAEFGPQPPADFADLGVFVTHTVTVKRKITTTTFKANVISWTNTQIVVNAGTAAVNDKITVKTLNGENNINIAKR